jgi:hypothetical protein
MAERQAWQAKWKRERPERERQAEEARQAATQQRRLIESMPPDVRNSYETAKTQEHRRALEVLKLGTLRLQLGNIALENEELLRATGHQIKLVDGSQKLDKLMRAALYTENDEEAAALFAKARQLRAAGEGLDDPPTGTELLSHFLRSV